MATPLIVKIKRDSLICFKSSTEDIQLFNKKEKGFRFSHFALLKLPDIKLPTNNSNTLDFSRIQSNFVDGLSTATPPVEGDRIDLSASFQNYVLNFESLCIDKKDYVRQKRSVSERIFFKWLKEIGAIRFSTASTQKSNVLNRYTEEKENNILSSGRYYDRVIKYVGEISMQNKISGGGVNFEEVYLHIPSQAGVFNDPLFKTVSDVNYSPTQAIQRKDFQNSEFVLGYNNSSQQIAQLSLLAQYDLDNSGVLYSSQNEQNPSDSSLWFDYFAGENAYLTDKNFQDPTNDTITMSFGSTTKTFLRSRLDGITLDLDKKSYPIFNNPKIKTFDKAAEFGDSFDFNCVMLYYEIDVDGITETNLYGVLFVDDIIETVGGASKIGSIKKIKTNTLLGQTGTGYGKKLNFKIDNNNNITPSVDTDLNDYNSFSMQIFSEASAKMSRIMDMYEKTAYENKMLKEEIFSIKSLLTENKFDGGLILEQINTKIAENYLSLGVSSLVTKNNMLLEQILAGNSPIEISLLVTPNFFGGVKGGLNGNILSISLSDEKYSNIHMVQLFYGDNNENFLTKNTRYPLFVLDSPIPVVISGDINIYIKDEVKWKKSQSLKVVLAKNILLTDDANINLYTDYLGLVSQQSYGVFIGSVCPSGNNVEICCVDDVSYSFQIFH